MIGAGKARRLVWCAAGSIFAFATLMALAHAAPKENLAIEASIDREAKEASQKAGFTPEAEGDARCYIYRTPFCVQITSGDPRDYPEAAIIVTPTARDEEDCLAYYNAVASEGLNLPPIDDYCWIRGLTPQFELDPTP